ncbi:MAG: DNA polymerase I [Bacteroidetes bacterium 4572_117]|nr:MAG: DNA polymerase I [Bacteroidetes bacterium 4572_117]
METNEKKLFLIDAYALIFRAYYAFINNPRINSKGLNTSAAFGFTNALDEILKKEKPSHIAVVFDHKEGSFRKKLYPEYKANRKPTPEDIIKSVPYIKQILEGFKIPIIEVPNYEADDSIGTLAKQAGKRGFDVFMMTPDKDFGQLVEENIKIYKPARKGKPVEILGVWEIRQKYGIDYPEQVIDILALWGDAVDNVPGVSGIGEKKASKLVAEYGSVEKIYENLHKIKGKLKENLEACRDTIKLSKELVTIPLDVPVIFDEELYARKEKDKEKLMSVFDELGFRNIAARVIGVPQTTTKPKNVTAVQGSLFGDVEVPVKQDVSNTYDSINTVEHRYTLVETKNEREILIEQLSAQKEFCFDTETTGLVIHGSEIVGIAFSYKKHEAFYVALPNDFDSAMLVLKEFKSLFQDKNICKIGQNLKFDLLMLKNYGIELAGELFDTMLAHYLLRPEQPHNFNYLAENYLNYQTVKIEELIGQKGKYQLNMRQITPKKVAEYAGEDADITLQLKAVFEPMLKEKNLDKLAKEIEMPLVPVLAEMEYTGVKLDTENMKAYANKLREKIIAVEKQIFKYAGMEFNIASPKQMGEVLFDRMKIIENPKKTKTGQYATGEQELQKIKSKHEIIEKILDFRGLQKLLSTYVDALPKLVNSKTGMVHTSFNQAITATGRLSSSNPNLQNIPIRTIEGREIRKAFIPSGSENLIFSADYSQIELRLMAHMSVDENMIKAFVEGEDIHSATAAKIFNQDLENVSRDMRSRAKSANFGIIYGISSFGLAQNLGIKRSEAKELIDNYFKTYPKIREYMDKQLAFARENLWVETLNGRRRYLADINSNNGIVKGVAERNAINAPIQGSAADVIKIAMINIYNKLLADNYKSKMILQVHDELVFDVVKSEKEKLVKMVVAEMENAVKLSIPLTVDSGIGKNWLEAH